MGTFNDHIREITKEKKSKGPISLILAVIAVIAILPGVQSMKRHFFHVDMLTVFVHRIANQEAFLQSPAL